MSWMMASMINSRAESLFEAHKKNIFKRTDKLFAYLLILEYLGGILAAYIISPKTWYGQISETHVHVWAAIFLGGSIVSLPVALAFFRPGSACTRHIIAVGQMLMSALLIHLTGGRIETHFHVFGSLAFLAFYRDWRVLITASTIVAIDHYVRGVYWPQSVFGTLSPGSFRWLEHTAWVIFEDLFLFLAIHQSVQEMKSIALKTAELEKTNTAREVFLSVCSHELKTPLTSLKLQAQLNQRLLKKNESNFSRDKIAEILNFTETQINTLTRIVEEMLDVSRIQTDKLHLTLEKIDFSKLICSIVEKFVPAFENAGCSVTVNANESIVGYWDSFRLEQVVTNLITNCLKYGAGKPIEISVSRSHHTVSLRVEDHGIGISSENQKKIFQRFERVISNKNISGLGLGLYIAKNIVELHGGSIDLESEIGRGSTFTVKLPINSEIPSTAAPTT